jgi:hypothetical protein
MVKLSRTSFCLALEATSVDPALPFELAAEAFDAVPGCGSPATGMATLAGPRVFLAIFASVI